MPTKIKIMKPSRTWKPSKYWTPIIDNDRRTTDYPRRMLDYISYLFDTDDRRLTQRQFARRLARWLPRRISQPTLNAWLNGKTRVPPDVVPALERLIIAAPKMGHEKLRNWRIEAGYGKREMARHLGFHDETGGLNGQ